MLIYGQKQHITKGMLERFNTTGVIEAKDVIRLFLGNDFNMGNIFKAYCRITSLRQGKGKAGIDEQYDLTKAKYFTEDELNYYLENEVCKSDWETDRKSTRLNSSHSAKSRMPSSA